MTDTTTPRVNGLAVASLALGVVAVLVGWVAVGIPGAVAAVLGHRALNQTAERGERGHMLAVVGLTCGYVGAALGLLVLVSLVLNGGLG